MYFNDDLFGARGFDLVAAAYDRSRPAYPKFLFEGIESEVALEVGSGSGQATADLLRISGHVDCLEPGANFCRLLEAKFALHDNFKVHNVKFEEFTPSVKYDLIFAASALHWVEKRLAYLKIGECLKSGGKLIAVWNQPRFSDAVYAAINDSIGQLVPDFYIPRCGREEVSLFENGFREFAELGTFESCEIKISASEREGDASVLLNLIWSYVNVEEVSEPQSLLSELKDNLAKLKASDYRIVDNYLISTGVAV